MLPTWKQRGLRLFLGTLFMVAEAKHFDLSSSPQTSHGHHLRRNMGTDYNSPQSLVANEHRVTNVTTQIGTNAFLPCKVRTLHHLTTTPLSLTQQPHPPSHRHANWPTSPCPGFGYAMITYSPWTDSRSSQMTATRPSTQRARACGRCKLNMYRLETRACMSAK